MDDDYINIANGDTFTLAPDPYGDGAWCIKIQNTVWVEDPRWLLFSVAGAYDRKQSINQLIDALTELRDRTDASD